MFGTALRAAVSGGGNSSEYATNTGGGLKEMVERIHQATASRKTTSAPEIPMSESYNSAASLPVFPPATQERAAAVFGTNDQRQMSTTGFKQDIKERIIEDISSL